MEFLIKFCFYSGTREIDSATVMDTVRQASLNEELISGYFTTMRLLPTLFVL